MTAGIYAIVNIESGRRYVGSSRNIERRWVGRKNLLQKGMSENKELQADWLTIGPGGFQLVVLEELDTTDALAEAEQRWIDRYKDRCYNVRVSVWRTPYARQTAMQSDLVGMESMSMDEFKRRRVAAGLSQAGIAARLGLHVMTVSKWERGINPVPPWVSVALPAIEHDRRTEQRHAEPQGGEG